jgi:glutathione S-transferase
MPKFLGYFERLLETHPGGGRHLVGKSLSYVDLSMFQVIEGLNYAFPKKMQGMSPKHPRLMALSRAVGERPRIAAYLASGRRLPFNQHGLFRHYPELDAG